MTNEELIPIMYPYLAYHLKLLRGWVKFPTGGTARELSPAQPIRSDSGADSKVWMREERKKESNMRLRALLSSPPPLKQTKKLL